MRKLQIGVAALIIAILAGILWHPIIDPFLHRERYREEVRTLYENLQPGMTKEHVRREMDSGKYPHLDFHRNGQLWLGSAPLEFGAGNWVLAVEFEGDQLVAVRVRKGDGLQVRGIRNITIPLGPGRTRCDRRVGPHSRPRSSHYGCPVPKLCPRRSNGALFQPTPHTTSVTWRCAYTTDHVWVLARSR